MSKKTTRQPDASDASSETELIRPLVALDTLQARARGKAA
jgi:hypothetical protein